MGSVNDVKLVIFPLEAINVLKKDSNVSCAFGSEGVANVVECLGIVDMEMVNWESHGRSVDVLLV